MASIPWAIRWAVLWAVLWTVLGAAPWTVLWAVKKGHYPHLGPFLELFFLPPEVGVGAFLYGP